MADNPAPLILLTRPRQASERYARDLEARLGGAIEVVIAPLMEIVTLSEPPDLSAVGGVILTSEVAARMVSAPQPLTAWCVGDRTARVAAEAGFSARSAGGTAEDLIRLILRHRPEGPLLHLAGRHTRGRIAERLTEAGLPARDVAIYDQQVCPPPEAFQTAMTYQGPVLVPLFSPRSAKIFASATGSAAAGNMRLLAMSDAVRDALPADWQARCAVIAAPRADAMTEGLRRILRGDTSVDGLPGLV